MPLRYAPPRLRYWLDVAWRIGFTILVLVAFRTSDNNATEARSLGVENRNRIVDIDRLGQENKNRIVDIQEARQASCETTYEGIRKVFRPFFPADPTPAEQKNLDKFNRTVDDLISDCPQQTRTQKPGG